MSIGLIIMASIKKFGLNHPLLAANKKTTKMVLRYLNHAPEVNLNCPNINGGRHCGFHGKEVIYYCTFGHSIPLEVTPCYLLY